MKKSASLIMGSDKIETRTGLIWLGDDGIIRMEGRFPNINITIVEAKENIAVFKKLAQGIKRPLFIDISKLKSMDRESRIYTSGEESGNFTTSIAILIGSPISRVIGNFFVGLNRPKFPTKLFTSEDEAIRWLEGFIEKK